MSDRMTPIPFGILMRTILSEYKQNGSVFGVRKKHIFSGKDPVEVFDGQPELPIGPAAGPASQLAQNIAAAYFSGCRYFELKTVQELEGPDLAIGKPCIYAKEEGYNCEWSTELTVSEAFNEYVKAWWACSLMAVEFGLGSPSGFLFNMSVGYDMAGIRSRKIDSFIEGLKDASDTEIWKECRKWTQENMEKFSVVTEREISSVSPKICSSVTLSTLHGCPSGEIEKIAAYLLSEKHLNTLIKCNPTLLGFDRTRKILDAMGYDSLFVERSHFEKDCSYGDLVSMIHRLLALSESLGLRFGVKLTNTLPVIMEKKELASAGAYLSGSALFPVSLSVARLLSEEFGNALPISYSGGADALNVRNILETGIRPVTFATTLLKPGGYSRAAQIAENAEKAAVPSFPSADRIRCLLEEVLRDPRYRKSLHREGQENRTGKIPLFDCFTAPCRDTCPIHQDIAEYLSLLWEERYADALKIIGSKNPLPGITGTICPHPCEDGCMGKYTDASVGIRAAKLSAFRFGAGSYETYLKEIRKKISGNGIRVAVIGAGPAGISCANYLLRFGFSVTIFDKRKKAGGTVSHIIPEERISGKTIEQDIAFTEALGAEFRFETEIRSAAELRKNGYSYIILAAGAPVPKNFGINGGTVLSALSFLEKRNCGEALLLGPVVSVIGGGNTAVDAARAAGKLPGVKQVHMIYRRDKKSMPAFGEETEAAFREGIRLYEFLVPERMEKGKLICRKTVSTGTDPAGRTEISLSEEEVSILSDTVIAAVGEETDTNLFTSLGIEYDCRGLPICNEANLSVSAEIYLAGDCLHGPKTVVDAIADAQKCTADILKREGIPAEADILYADGKKIREEAEKCVSEKEYLDRRGILTEGRKRSCGECFGCGRVCEVCAEVCPNRANIRVTVPGMSMPQILHIKSLCNECGNCAVFCPQKGKPYLEKLTLFQTKEEFDQSENEGFLFLNREKSLVLIRLGGRVSQISLQGESLSGDLEKARQVIQCFLLCSLNHSIASPTSKP